MNRRQCLTALAGVAAVTALRGRHAAAAGPRAIPISFDPREAGAEISPRFMGLGYEISSVAIPGLLRADNRSYVRMVRNLSTQGVIRVGGNTSDYAAWSPDGQALSAPKATVINRQSLEDLAGFLRATGWTLIWGLNLGQNREEEAVREARAVADAVGTPSVTFEIGNEPDLFAPAHRAHGYDFEQWWTQYGSYAARIAKAVPGAAFAGPDAAARTDWVAEFARRAPANVKLLTHHYYREGPPASPASTIDTLLQPDPKLARMLAELRTASQAGDRPFRICETNSCFGGGKPGVSDAFASALWALEYLFTLAEAGAQGLNMETGVNQLGFVSSYSPIVATAGVPAGARNASGEATGYIARPIYYGMLAFRHAGGGRLLPLRYDAGAAQMTAHAVLAADRRVTLVLINKEPARDLEIRVAPPREYGLARVFPLSAPSVESKAGVRFGASAVSSDGRWTPAPTETRRLPHAAATFQLKAASALLIQLLPA